MSKQPEALRLAHLLAPDEFSPATLTERQAAAELRRLHALNGELLEALELCMCAIALAGWDADYCMVKAREVKAKAEAA